MDLLKYAAPDDISKNYGNSVTNDLKWHIKYYRHNHIHVSPTVLVNGLIDNDIGSSWTLDQWKKLILSLVQWPYKNKTIQMAEEAENQKFLVASILNYFKDCMAKETVPSKDNEALQGTCHIFILFTHFSSFY